MIKVLREHSFIFSSMGKSYYQKRLRKYTSEIGIVAFLNHTKGGIVAPNFNNYTKLSCIISRPLTDNTEDYSESACDWLDYLRVEGVIDLSCDFYNTFRENLKYNLIEELLRVFEEESMMRSLLEADIDPYLFNNRDLVKNFLVNLGYKSDYVDEIFWPLSSLIWNDSYYHAYYTLFPESEFLYPRDLSV